MISWHSLLPELKNMILHNCITIVTEDFLDDEACETIEMMRDNAGGQMKSLPDRDPHLQICTEMTQKCESREVNLVTTTKTTTRLQMITRTANDFDEDMRDCEL